MRPPINGFWGKLRRDEAGEVVAWHPLEHHCADVAAVMEALLQIRNIRHRLARLAGKDDLTAREIARLCVLTALHDLGKANLGFQAKGVLELGTAAGHVGEALALLFRGSAEYREPLQLSALQHWGDATGELLAASVSHHGRPLGENLPPFQHSWWQARGGRDPKEELGSLVRAARGWFPLAFQSGEPLPDSIPFQHAFAGLVMLADWIGSDAHQSAFPYSEDRDFDRISFARDRARHILETMGIANEAARRSVKGKDAFHAIAPDLSPRSAQRGMMEIGVPTKASLSVLEAETGSGKTEAALTNFVELFAAGEVDGLVFALPTRSAATQIFERVTRATAHAFPDALSRPPVILAVPGYLRMDDQTGRALPGFEVLWPDGNRERDRHRGWAAEGPKRFLAGPIVVGTVDQVLLSALQVPHAHLRAAALLRHLLVIDEVHASDAYMTRILHVVLSRHVLAGGHALLLSATLGGEARARFLGEPTPSFEEARETPYPLVSRRQGDSVLQETLSHDGHERNVRVEALPSMERPDEVGTLAVGAARQGARVIVLRNTVTACIETQTEVERQVDGGRGLLFACNTVIAPHHSRFARVDRELLDRELERRFGKTRGRARAVEGCIVVTTQTVQQSLDLDADFLITDLCPVDVLLQRIGRVHRNAAHARPDAYRQARACVLVPRHRDLTGHIRDTGQARWKYGVGTVYGDLRLLEAAWRVIEKHPTWYIPTMCRRLVEEGVHEEELARIVDQGGDVWATHRDAVLGTTYGDKRLADLNLVDWDRAYMEQSFPSDRRIPSRLGEDDRRIIFPEPPVGPFGREVKELNAKASWVRDVPADLSEGTNVRPEPSGFSFCYGDHRFIYDRFGLRPKRATDPTWSEEEDDDTT